MPEQVSPATTDAVTQANVKVVGEAPAVALGTLMQSNSHASAILLHNAVQMQANQAASTSPPRPSASCSSMPARR